MSPAEPNSPYLSASLLGSATNVIGKTCAHPCEVIKTRQQTVGGSVFTVARTLFKENGIWAFYRGYIPQMVRSTITGSLAWPTMKGTLSELQQKTTLPAVLQQVIAGVSSAAVSVLATNPLDKAKVEAIQPGKQAFDFKRFVRTGWQGAGANWATTSINYSLFLMLQKKFQQKAPTFPDYVATGAKVAACLTAASNGTDVITTILMSRKSSWKQIVASNPPSAFVRGLIPSFFGRIIPNSISAWLVEKLAI